MTGNVNPGRSTTLHKERNKRNIDAWPDAFSIIICGHLIVSERNYGIHNVVIKVFKTDQGDVGEQVLLLFIVGN